MCEKNQKRILKETVEERMESPNGRRTASSDADILFVSSLWVWPTFSHAVVDRIARLVGMFFISHYSFFHFDVSIYAYNYECGYINCYRIELTFIPCCSDSGVSVIHDRHTFFFHFDTFQLQALFLDYLKVQDLIVLCIRPLLRLNNS